jgi:hypothetical protein
MKQRMADPGNIFETMVLRDDACFLCGALLQDQRTREHVFAKWLQHKHDLWDKQLKLLNETFIRYRQLVVPCCTTCNNEHLSRLETQVEGAFRAGYAAVKQLPALVLYQWAGKVFYGILRKELRLLADLADRNSGTIIPADLLEGFMSLHLFMQSIRRPFVFRDGEPFTSLVVKLHHGDGFGDFDFRDDLQRMLVSIRSYDVGLIIALQDAGLTKGSYGRYVDEVNGEKLMPIQFDELFTKVLYGVSLLTRIPKFVTAVSDDLTKPVDVHMLPLGGLSTVPVVREWSQEEYAHHLEAVFAHSQPDWTFDKLYVPPNQVRTWMTDASGKLTFFEPDGRLKQSEQSVLKPTLPSEET